MENSVTRERLIQRLKREALSRANGGTADILLTTREAALLLGVSYRSARLKADSGKLKCVRTLGGHRRFKGSSVYAQMVSAGVFGLEAAVYPVGQRA